jgi:hypothetical protein
MIAIKSGSTSWRAVQGASEVQAGEVAYSGTFACAADGYTPLMVWDAGVGNVRAMTTAEIAALPAQKATAIAQQEKALATAAVDNGSLQVGMKVDRLTVALALVLRDEINLLRAAISHPITSITRSTTTATVTTPTAHGLAVGDPVAIMGADVASYNVTTTVASVVSATVFTYTMANSGITPATGSMFYTLGAVPQMPVRTLAQVIAAVKAKIAATAE